MADQHLENMSLERLRCIGRRLGIKDDEILDRQELIDAIEEILEERTSDRLRQNNEVMNLKGKKYDLIDDVCSEADGEPFFEIPEGYCETSVHMLLRDPHWAFVYWNLNSKDMETMKEQRGEFELTLRIHEFSHPRLPVTKCRNYFDIPVREEDSSWYVNLLKLGRWYVASLLAGNAEWSEVLASSNEIFSPEGYWVERVEELKADERELMLFHAAVTDYSGHEVDSVLVKSMLDTLGRNRQ